MNESGSDLAAIAAEETANLRLAMAGFMETVSRLSSRLTLAADDSASQLLALRSQAQRLLAELETLGRCVGDAGQGDHA